MRLMVCHGGHKKKSSAAEAMAIARNPVLNSVQHQDFRGPGGNAFAPWSIGREPGAGPPSLTLNHPMPTWHCPTPNPFAPTR